MSNKFVFRYSANILIMQILHMKILIRNIRIYNNANCTLEAEEICIYINKIRTVTQDN